jgi:hypothetical protein
VIPDGTTITVDATGVISSAGGGGGGDFLPLDGSEPMTGQLVLSADGMAPWGVGDDAPAGAVGEFKHLNGSVNTGIVSQGYIVIGAVTVEEGDWEIWGDFTYGMVGDVVLSGWAGLTWRDPTSKPVTNAPDYAVSDLPSGENLSFPPQYFSVPLRACRVSVNPGSSFTYTLFGSMFFNGTPSLVSAGGNIMARRVR